MYLYQLLPEQAASYLNYASRVSIPSYKSPKGAAGFPLPGRESFPENSSSIKMYVLVISCRTYMSDQSIKTFWSSLLPFLCFFFQNRLEAAMQRLTNLCSVLNDMEPICVLNHVFVLREVWHASFNSSLFCVV